jgi:tetratricopeptide (TPR) repeat protein
MPNLINVPVAPGGSQAQQVDACLSAVKGEYVTIVPSNYSIGEMWMEDSNYAFMNNPVHKSAVELESSTDERWGAVIKKDALIQARRQFPNLTIPESLRRAGIVVDRIGPEDIPFQFDELYNQAKREEEDGNWSMASEIYEHIIKNHANKIWVKGLAARSLFETGNYQKAFQYSQEVNEQRPTVDTLVTEARVHRKQKNFDRAINLYDKAREILEGRQLQWMS